MAIKRLKDFVVHNDGLYHRGTGVVLGQALSLAEAKEELFPTHDISCEENDINLYTCLQRQ